MRRRIVGVFLCSPHKTLRRFVGASQVPHGYPLQHIDAWRSIADPRSVLKAVECGKQPIVPTLVAVYLGRGELNRGVIGLQR